MEEDKIEQVIDKLDAAYKLIGEAREVAETIESSVGEYYGGEQKMYDVIDRYFQYHSYKPFSEYWESSSATC